jgi:transmembrane sensor
MMRQDEQEIDEAIGWIIRLRDPEFANWEQFTVWLEEAENAKAYERLSRIDADVADALAVRPAVDAAANDDAPAGPSRQRSLRWASGIAAALAIAIAYPFIVAGPRPSRIETRAAEHRAVVLPDGSQVELNGNSLLVMDRSEPRIAALQRGEAVFTVKHDRGAPFTVTAGPVTVRDVGTVFNIARGDGWTEVAVARGAVDIGQTAAPVIIRAGHMVHVSDDGNIRKFGVVEPAAVGAWREGRLVYRDAFLSRISYDLTRNIGETVTAAPDVAGNSFSGTIKIDKDKIVFFRKLEGLLGVSATHDSSGWHLAMQTATHP